MFAIPVVKENLYKPPPVFCRDHGSPYSIWFHTQALSHTIVSYLQSWLIKVVI